MKPLNNIDKPLESKDGKGLMADLEKIEFDVQQDLLNSLKEMYEKEKSKGQSNSNPNTKENKTMKPLNNIDKPLESKDGKGLMADLEKIEFDVQQDLLNSLKEMYEKEKSKGQSFSDWLKSKPLDELKRIELNNGGSVGEKYEELLDAFEKGIDVMPGEDLTKYIERVRKAELLEKLKDK